MLSVRYHEIFDYHLTKDELVKWQYKSYIETTDGVKNKGRFQREKYSEKKLIIAQKASKIIGFFPTIKMVAITGSLAMKNAKKGSDIDLMIITKKGSLWITRLFVYVLLYAKRYTLRRSRVKDEKDALCLNIWLDEEDLEWPKSDRNIYTAHEIAQIVPLVNKNQTHERFLRANRWILDYWPNAVLIKNYKTLASSSLKIINSSPGLGIIERLAFKLQFLYMRKKITREVITPTRALFHPQDWGKVVLSRLKQEIY